MLLDAGFIVKSFILSTFKVVSCLSLRPNVLFPKVFENQRFSAFSSHEKETSRRNGLSLFEANVSLNFYTFFVPAAQ